MRARIYKPARSAMQSGTAKTHEWLLEMAPQAPKKRDPLMGWSGSKGTANQIKMRFKSKEEAMQYAIDRGMDFDVIDTVARKRKHNIRPLGYAENFVPSRRMPWTH